MKTISGNVSSTKPISLFKAAKVLSNFVTAETGASHAVSAYLRRASVSFNELVRFHKELKASKPDRKHKKHVQECPVKYEQNSEEYEGGPSFVDGVGKRHKQKLKKKKKKSEDVERGGGSLLIEEGNRKEKKRKSREVDDREVVDSAEQSKSKKKKKRRIEHDQ